MCGGCACRAIAELTSTSPNAFSSHGSVLPCFFGQGSSHCHTSLSPILPSSHTSFTFFQCLLFWSGVLSLPYFSQSHTSLLSYFLCPFSTTPFVLGLPFLAYITFYGCCMYTGAAHPALPPPHSVRTQGSRRVKPHFTPFSVTQLVPHLWNYQRRRMIECDFSSLSLPHGASGLYRVSKLYTHLTYRTLALGATNQHCSATACTLCCCPDALGPCLLVLPAAV